MGENTVHEPAGKQESLVRLAGIVAATVAVTLVMVIVFPPFYPGSSPAEGVVLGPASVPGTVLVSSGDRVVLARDPYPPSDSLESGEPVLLSRPGSGLEVSGGVRITSVPSDDATAVAAARDRADERLVDQSPYAVRPADGGM